MARPKYCRTVKKSKGTLARYVRLWIIGLSISGTRAFLFRAVRYSVLQFLRSFSLLLSALMIVPKGIGSGLICVKNTAVKTLNRETWIRAEWSCPGSWAITTTLKDAVAGVPSLFRSIFASVQAQFYGVAHSFYHVIEALKSLYNVHAGYFQQFGQAVAHGFFAVKSFVFGTFSAVAISVSHFFEYIAGLWETFRTGTSQTVNRLWEKEQTWKTQVFSSFDDGRDYISKKLTQIFEVFSSGFHQCGQAVHNFQDRSVALFQTARIYWSTAVNKVKTSVGSAVDEVEEIIVARVKGLVVTIRAGYENMLNRFKSGVNAKDSVVTVRGRVEDLADGFTISSIRTKISEANKTITILIKGSFEKSKGLLQSWDRSIRLHAAEGKRLLVLHISAAGRSTGHFLWRLSRPIVTPVTYLVTLPSRAVRTVTTTPCWTYLYIVGLFAATGYLTYLIKCRHKNENYARKLKPPKKVRY